MIRARYASLLLALVVVICLPQFSSALLTDSAAVGGNTLTSGAFNPANYATWYLHDNPTPPSGDVATTLADGESKTAYVVVDTPTAPTAGFVADITSGFAPLTVNFSDLSTGDATSWSWNFGDATSSTAQNPSKTYTSPGTYTVTLTATNATGSDPETRSGYIVVALGSPLTRYSSSNSVIAGGGWGTQSNAYSDDNVDATRVQSKNTTVTGSWGGFDFSAIPAGSTINSVTMQVEWFASSSQPAFSAQAYVGGTPRGSALAPATPTTRTLSTHTNTGLTTLADLNAATIRVTSARDNAGPNNITINLDHVRLVVDFTPPTNAALGANFSGTPVSGTHPLTVAFTDSSSGSPTEWGWDFDNNGLIDDRSQNPTYTYPAPGTYSVRLVAANAGRSGTLTRTNYITVSAPGITGSPNTAEFYGSPLSGVAPLNVNFVDRSSSSPTAWSWDFGDGGVSSAQNPTHNYTTPGTYTVTLTASWGATKLLSADTTVPTGSTLYNYSVEYGAGTGRLLSPGGSGAGELDTDQAVWWRGPTMGTARSINGNVLVRTYTQLAGAGSITVYLRDLNVGAGTYTEIASVIVTRSDWDSGSGGFVGDDIIIPVSGQTLAVGHALEIKLVSASGADMRVAYDTAYPALVRLP